MEKRNWRLVLGVMGYATPKPSKLVMIYFRHLKYMQRSDQEFFEMERAFFDGVNAYWALQNKATIRKDIQSAVRYHRFRNSFVGLVWSRIVGDGYQQHADEARIAFAEAIEQEMWEKGPEAARKFGHIYGTAKGTSTMFQQPAE